MILDEETGQLVLDRASLTMQAQPRQEYTRREEGQHDIVNSQSYMKRENTARWSPEETEEFYSVRVTKENNEINCEPIEILKPFFINFLNW